MQENTETTRIVGQCAIQLRDSSTLLYVSYTCVLNKDAFNCPCKYIYRSQTKLLQSLTHSMHVAYIVVSTGVKFNEGQ